MRPGPHDQFDIRFAFIESVLLLTSSLTFGMASMAVKYHAGRARVALWLGAPLAPGLIFLGLEVHDFAGMAAKGGVPS